MPDQRLTARDIRTLLLWVAIGVAGALVSFRFFHAAFPEAAVDFKVSRPQAVEAARAFLARQGHQVNGYQSSIVFEVDENAKTYLEREAGLTEANRLMASQVSVWYWDVRFFRPQQQEEFNVRVSPAGQIVGFRHTVEEARAGARLTRAAAENVAEKFFAANVAEGGAYDLLPAESSSTDRPNRRDWSFTWERRGFKAPSREDGAPYRVRVAVLGDQPGALSEFLKVPEAWERGYEKLRSSNTFYGTVAFIPYLFLNGGLLWVIFELSRRGLIRWSGALKLGIVLAALFFAMTANQWPIERASYDTNSSYLSFLLEHLARAALGSLALGMIVGLTVAAAEPLYRSSQPDHLRLDAAWTLPGIRTKEFFRSSVVGLGMAAGHIGFVVLFYLVGGKLGVWAPQEIDYTNVVSTALPWLYPLTIGVYAATSEEFLFRLFAIPFLARVTKSRFLAVVLPAFAWGFLHSTYPQEPGYIRGIEVGVIGIVAGIVMLRYGILATLVWHYTVDALLISLFLLRSENAYFRVSGALVGAGALIPLLISGGFYLARRRFEVDEPLVNRSEPLIEKPATEVVAAEPIGAEAAEPSRLKLVVACGVVGLLAAVAVRPHAIGEFMRYHASAKECLARADKVLRERGIDPGRYRRTATLTDRSDPYVNEFLRRKIGIAGANRLYQEKVPLALWRLRYLRDGEKEEYAVVLKTDGALHAVHHTLEEKAPGAKLSQEEARAKAEAYLRDEKKVDLSRWKLVEGRADARPARTDHTFVWEETEAAAGTGTDAAHVRAEVKVLGDEISGYRVFVKIPEEWQRKQTERTFARVAMTIYRGMFFGGVVVAVIVLFFKNLRQQTVPWARMAKWSLVALVGFGIGAVNNWPQMLANYQTAIPLNTFLALVGVALFMTVLVSYVTGISLLGFGWFFTARAFGEHKLPSRAGMQAEQYRDAAVIAVAGTAALAGVSKLLQAASQAWPTFQRSVEATVASGLDSYYPAAQAIGSALGRGVLITGAVAIAAGLVAAYAKERWTQIGLLLLAAFAMVGPWGSPADLAKQFLLKAAFVGAWWLGVRYIVRYNALAYFLMAALATLLPTAVMLVEQPNSFLRRNGYAAFGIAAVLLAFPVMAWRRARTSRTPVAASASSGD